MAETTYSDWVQLTATTMPAPLEDEPQEFKEKASTHNSLTLAWKASEKGTESGYQLEKDVNGTWQELAVVLPLEFTDTNLEPNTSYNYRIRAVFQ